MSSRTRHRFVFLAALGGAALLLPGLALAQSAAGTCAPGVAGAPSTCLTNGFFDTILSMVENATANWVSVGAGKTGIGWVIFTSLATLELVWWGITNALRKNDLGEWFSSLFLKMLEISFFGFVVATAPTWMPYIPQQFETIGQKFLAASQFGTPAGAATVPLTPSGIMTEAANVEGILWNGGNPTRVAGGGNPTTSCGTFDLGCKLEAAAENAMEGMVASLATVITSLLLYLGFGLVALQLMMTLIEMYMVLGIGSVMLGFLGSRWTVQFGERYASYAASVGVKLLTTYGVSAVMVHLAQQDASWLHQLAAGQVLPAPNMLALGTSGLLGGIMALTIPSVAGSIMGGTASLGLSHLTSAGGSVASAGAAAGLGAAAGVASGKATGAALARLAGLTSVAGSSASGVGGAGSSVGGFRGGAGAIAATPPPPGGIGGAAGAGMGAGGKAAGAGVAAAGKAAGAAISAVPGLQPVGAAVSAAGQAAGKGVEAAGKAAEQTTRAAGQAAGAARGAAGAASAASGGGATAGAARTGAAPGTGGPDQLSAPAGASPAGGAPPAGEGEKKEPSAASKLLRQAQHHAGQAHRGLPHEGGVSAPGLRFGHSED
jgi:type IV secretion system protein TrbL